VKPGFDKFQFAKWSFSTTVSDHEH